MFDLFRYFVCLISWIFTSDVFRSTSFEQLRHGISQQKIQRFVCTLHCRVARILRAKKAATLAPTFLRQKGPDIVSGYKLNPTKASSSVQTVRMYQTYIQTTSGRKSFWTSNGQETLPNAPWWPERLTLKYGKVTGDWTLRPAKRVLKYPKINFNIFNLRTFQSLKTSTWTFCSGFNFELTTICPPGSVATPRGWARAPQTL